MELNAEVVTPHISINALKKTIGFHTLRVTYKENKHPIFITIDFRSTHNFIN
jgi:hypothetical protein